MKTPGKAGRAIKIIFLVILLVILAFLAYIFTHITNNNLTTTSYTVNAPVAQSVRILQLTDLHKKEFGENNEELLQLIKEQKPDVIFCTGDMINKDDPDIDNVVSFVHELSTIATTFYSYGNHEITWEETYFRDLEKIMKRAGAIVLRNSFMDVDLKGTPVRIGGYGGYFRKEGMHGNDPSIPVWDESFAGKFEDTDRYKILLNHAPTSWLNWDHINMDPVDLVFCGHYHGGQWVLPLIGPIFETYSGFNPSYTHGLYEGTTTSCILSSGLGNEYSFVPRVNNPPEIVVVDLIPE